MMAPSLSKTLSTQKQFIRNEDPFYFPSAKHSSLTDLSEGLRRFTSGEVLSSVCSPAVHVPSSDNNSKVLVLGEGGVGWEEIRSVRGHDQHKATERSMTLGRDWIRQNAKPHMTYDQFLNQTERGRKKGKGGLRKKRREESKGRREWQPYRCFAFISTSED